MTKMFSTTARLRRGYSQEEVNEFFEYARSEYEASSHDPITHRDIHTHVFGLERNGYETTEVDAAMDRLENAFVAKARQEYVAHHGSSGWSALLNQQAQSLYPRLTRKPGTRFAPPPRGRRGYNTAQVDEMCQRLVDFFNGKEQVTAAQIRSIRFDAAKRNHGYNENSVDFFIARAVEVLLGVQ